MHHTTKLSVRIGPTRKSKISPAPLFWGDSNQKPVVCAKLFMKNIYALYLVLFCNRISFISLFQFSVRCFQIHCNGLFVCLMCVLLHIRTDLLDVRVIPPSRPGAGGSLLSFVIIIIVVIVEICTLFREHSMVPEVQPHVCALAPVYHGRTIVFGC